ncbi:MAG: hypothetical protein AAF368_16170, partial [Planctomycetota bacterium]
MLLSLCPSVLPRAATPQASETRVSELEAQTSSLTALNGRITRARDALVDDAFNAEDLLCAAAERMRRSRTGLLLPTGAAERRAGTVGRFSATAAASPKEEGTLPGESLASVYASLRGRNLASSGDGGGTGSRDASAGDGGGGVGGGRRRR